MKSSFERELQDFGLSEKEARVYLASLELGPSSVQKISVGAGVKRATTYVMIESLIERGLMSSFVKGKKTIFRAESPEHLKHQIEHEQVRLREKIDLLEDLLPRLSEISAVVGEGPKVRMFEGLSGLHEIHEDLLRSLNKGDKVENFASLDLARDLISLDDLQGHWEDLHKKKVRVRAIYTKTGKSELIPDKYSSLWEERRVSEKLFPFHGEVVIYRDKVAVLAFKGKIVGAIIESSVISQTCRAMFELAWIGAKEQEIK